MDGYDALNYGGLDCNDNNDSVHPLPNEIALMIAILILMEMDMVILD